MVLVNTPECNITSNTEMNRLSLSLLYRIQLIMAYLIPVPIGQTMAYIELGNFG